MDLPLIQNPTDQGLNRVPKRSSLLHETISVLRGGIQVTRWTDHIPGERELAIALQVSRPTVRTALRVLEKEGLVRISQGRRTRIVERRKNVAPLLNANLVAFLSPTPMNQVRNSNLLRINELQTQFYKVGVDFHFYDRPRCYNARPGLMLQSIVNEARAGCWILSETTLAVQQWFQSNQVPCVILGTAFPGVDIPCIDVNNFALCSHAVGLFRNRGHSRIGFLLQDNGTAGNESAVAGFSVSFGKNRTVTERPLVMRCNMERDQIINLLESKEFREYDPTALLLGGPRICLAVMTHLQHAGKQIPEDVAVISRVSDVWFDYVTPTVACYSRWDTIMEHAILHNTMDVLRGEYVVTRKKLIIPEFVPGESLG